MKDFTKAAHLFAHRKMGAMFRFQKEYAELAEKVRNNLLQQLIQLEEEYKRTAVWNQALASTAREFKKKKMEETARQILAEVNRNYLNEINRIIVSLNGYPQEDGHVLFPDGSVARMPKGLYIPEEMRFQI